MASMHVAIIVFFLEFISLSYARGEVPKLNCYNDYEKTMVCNLTSEKHLNCSRYGLDLSQPFILGHFTCTFTNSSRDSNFQSKCGCTIRMLPMVTTEQYNMSLLEGGEAIDSTSVTAMDNIKPKAPEILSVMPTQNADYNVTWRTNYNEIDYFPSTLITELSYKKKGEKVSEIVNVTLRFFEIPGSQLEPASEYSVKARSISVRYKTKFSDWSQETEWTTAATDQNTQMFIILAVCVFLIINICTFYWCCVRLKAKWWIPTPMNEIKNMLPGGSKVFIPNNFDPSSNSRDILTIDKTEKEPCVTPRITECDQDDPYKNVTCCVPAKDSGIGSSVDSQKNLSTSVGSSGSSECSYKNVQYTRVSATPCPGNSPREPPSSAPPTPRFDPGLALSESPALRTSDTLAHLLRNLEALSLFGKAPSMPTDFEYQPCDGGTAPFPPAGGVGPPGPFKVDSPAALLPSACRADDGYESFGEAVSRTALGQAHFPAGTLGPCEEGYQAHPALAEKRTDWLSGTGEADTEAC